MTVNRYWFCRFLGIILATNKKDHLHYNKPCRFTELHLESFFVCFQCINYIILYPIQSRPPMHNSSQSPRSAKYVFIGFPPPLLSNAILTCTIISIRSKKQFPVTPSYLNDISIIYIFFLSLIYLRSKSFVGGLNKECRT